VNRLEDVDKKVISRFKANWILEDIDYAGIKEYDIKNVSELVFIRKLFSPKKSYDLGTGFHT